MPYDRDKLHFLSLDPIDKIVQEGEITIVNDGDTRPNNWQLSKIVQQTQPNTYGRAGLIRGRWSINGGTDWQALHTSLIYNFNITSIFQGQQNVQGTYGNDSAVSIGSNNSQIYIRTANGRHGNVTENIDNNTTSYSPVSRTFLIQYWLFERE